MRWKKKDQKSWKSSWEKLLEKYNIYFNVVLLDKLIYVWYNLWY